MAAQGIHVGRKRVARLMRAAGVRGVSRRKWVTTTTRYPEARAAPDLVQRDFHVDGPDRLWVADITYVPTGAGFLYLAVVLDAWSRRVIGWAMATHLRTELVLAALDMALAQRQPRDVIHHSDHGCQYTAVAYGQRCQRFGVRPSMGTVGDAYDNAEHEPTVCTLPVHTSAVHRPPNRGNFSSCSACSSQKRMSISRYIVLAGLLALARAPGKLAEAEVAVGDEGAACRAPRRARARHG